MHHALLSLSFDMNDSGVTHLISNKHRMLCVTQFNSIIGDLIDYWLQLHAHNNDYYQHC